MRKGTLLQVAELGQSVLRKKAKVVTQIKSDEVKHLIDDLIATVMEVDGVGIAAPQVYKSLRIFIMASHPNPRYPYAPKMKPTAIINPKIISHSDKKIKGWEGCLSIPGIRNKLFRYSSIKVEYLTREGKRAVKTFNDFLARIFQHEYDYLEGLVIADKIESSRDLISEKEYQRLMRKK